MRFRSDWVRKRAKDVGYTRLEDLATDAGITRQHLHVLLKGGSLPMAETERGLARALRCLVDDLTEEVATGEVSS